MVFAAQRLTRLIFGTLIACCLLLIVATPAFAQNFASPNTESNVPRNLNSYTQNVFLEVINTLNCQLAGINTANPTQKCLGVNPKTGQIGFVENGTGLVGVTSNMIAVLYTPPASSGDYIRYITSDFGIVKSAHAQSYPQGFGFASIAPLAKVWGIFRNIVYMLFLIVFVIIGLGIMLRLPIDPRTVMSIGNQIPKIIIGLVMVTFSFGIAGFLIDIMWLGTYVTINVIASADPKIDVPKVNSKLYDAPVGFANETLKDKPGTGTTGPLGSEEHGILKVAIHGAGSVKDTIQNLFTPDIMKNSFLVNPGGNNDLAQCGLNFGCLLGDFTKKGLGSMLSAIFGWLIAYIVGALAILVFTIAILVALFRLWFTLLQAYILLLIDIVLAPFWLLASLFPGSTFTVGAWFRDMLANLMAFPTAITLILLGKVFMNAFANSTIASPISVPLIGNPGSKDTISSLIGIGFILLVPTATQMMRDLFKAPKFEYTKAIASSVGAGIKPVGTLGGGLWHRLMKVNATTGAAEGMLASRLQRATPRLAKFLIGAKRPDDFHYEPHVAGR